MRREHTTRRCPTTRLDRRSLVRRLSRSAALAIAAVLALATPSAASQDSWSLSGAGWGHGVGMSQYGAYQMALDGRTAPQILQHYYTGTTYEAVNDTAVISVNVVNRAASATMRTSALSSGGGSVSVTGGATTMTGGVGATLTATAPSGGSGVTITCTTCTPVTSVRGSRLTVAWDDDRTLLSVGGNSYRDGQMSLTRAGTTATLNVVAQVRIHDEYLDYIAEMPWSWHPEALRAQAAASRGFALAARAGGIRSDCDCHVWGTTASQVYAGYPSAANLPYWSRWTAAVRATGSPTTGYVVRHNGTIIQAVYHSSSGGHTQNNEDVWSGGPLPYLRGVNDPSSRTERNPRREWTVTKSPAELASAFGLGDVAKLDLSKRHASVGVASATATSASGATATISGEQLRTRLGLNSTYVQRKFSRLSGSNQYAVAASVASRIPVTAGTVVIASGEESALLETALAGPLASAVGGPLLLSRWDGLPAETTAELKRRAASVTTAYLVGPESVLTAKVATQLQGLGVKVVRLGGTHVYATSRLVAAEVARHAPVREVVVIAASGRSNAASVAGAAAALRMPILLTPSTTLSENLARSLDAIKPARAYIVGNGVTGAAESGVRARVKTVTRITGPTRYEISAAVARHFAPMIPGYDRVVISSGLDADLPTAVVAGSLKAPLLLVRPTSLPAVSRDTIQRLPKAGIVTAVGSAAMVSDSTAAAMRRS